MRNYAEVLKYSKMSGKMEYKRLLCKYHIIESKFFRWPL